MSYTKSQNSIPVEEILSKTEDDVNHWQVTTHINEKK